MTEQFQIQLQRQTPETVAQFWHASKNPQVSRYLPLEERDLPTTLERWQLRCRNETDGFGRAIYLNGEYVGDTWCFRDQDDAHLVFINIAIVKPESWGKGVGSSALIQFCSEVKTLIPGCALAAFVYEDNGASVKCFTKCGFAKIEELVEEGRRSFLLRLNQ